MPRDFSHRSSAFFRRAPTRDAVCMAKWPQTINQPLLNGFFQHIVWMGVSSYIVINHFDREILLVDPWPSYTRRNQLHYSTRWDGQQRLMRLANWLRAMNGGRSNYSVVAILLTHEHFDHIDDIVPLQKLLMAPYKRRGLPEWRVALRNRRRRPALTGRPFTRAEMPKIICDADIRAVLWSRHARSFDYETVTRHNKKRPVHVSEDFATHHATPLDAGLKCDPLSAGHYEIQPYIWDHSNTACGHRGPKEASGSWQRQLAFAIRRAGVPNAKSTFLISSSGEMGAWGTDTRVVAQLDSKLNPAPIKADLLIQGVPFPFQTRYRKRVKEMLHYHASNVDVADCILASHWDPFALSPAKNLTRGRHRAPFIKYRERMVAEGKGNKSILGSKNKAHESKKLAIMKRSIFHAKDKIPSRARLLFPSKPAKR